MSVFDPLRTLDNGGQSVKLRLMTKVATFTTRGRFLFYPRLLLIVLLFGFGVETSFSDYAQTGTYRGALPMVVTGSATYIVFYAKALWKLSQSQGAMIWLEDGRLHWLTDTFSSAPQNDLEDVVADGQKLLVSLRGREVRLNGKLASEPVSEIVSKLKELRVAHSAAKAS